MELDELKDIWKRKDAEFARKNEAELSAMLQGKSRSIVDKLIRSVWFELSITIAAGVALLTYAVSLPSGAVKWTSVSILVVFLAYLIYYLKKLSVLKQFSTAHENIKDNLSNLVRSLESYLRFYKRSYTILYPVYFFLGLLFGAVERGLDHFLHSLTTPKTILYLVLIAGLFYFVSTWLVEWFLKKLYGNHLEKLKALLQEFSAPEPDSQL